MPDATPVPPLVPKVAVTGSWGVGKTTLVRTLSEVSVLSTAPGGPLEVGLEEPTRTLALDLGRMSVDDGLSLHLLATPIPDPEDLPAVRDLLTPGLIGVVLLVDGVRADSAEEAVPALATFATDVDPVPVVVGVNRPVDGDGERTARRIRHVLRLGEDVPVVGVDVRQRDSARTLLLKLLMAARDRADQGADHQPALAADQA